MKMQSLSPVLFVPAIEPCLAFWTERLGFEIHVDVKEDGRYAFVLLGKDDVEIMYQTHASLAEDLPHLPPRDRESSVCLYLNVDDVAAVEKAMAGVEIVQPRRTTSYGAVELGVREPGGNLVLFAERSSR